MNYKSLVARIKELTGVETIPAYGSKAFADLIARLDEEHPDLATDLMDFTQRAGAKGYRHPDEEQQRGARRRAWLTWLGRKTLSDETSDEGGPSPSKVLRLLGVFFAVIMLSALGYGMYQSNQLKRLQLERLHQSEAEVTTEEPVGETQEQSVPTSGTTMQTRAEPYTETQNPYASSDTPTEVQNTPETPAQEPSPVLSVPLSITEAVTPPALSVEPAQPLPPLSSAATTPAQTLSALEPTAQTPLPSLGDSREAEAALLPITAPQSSTETMTEVETSPSLPVEPAAFVAEEKQESLTSEMPGEWREESGIDEPVTSAQNTDALPAALPELPEDLSSPGDETQFFSDELTTALLEPGQKISVRLATGITIVEGTSSPVLVESLPQTCLVVGLCETLIFRGNAELISGNKVRVGFDAVFFDGEEHPFQGIALDPYDNNAITVAVVDEAPTIAQDLLRNTLGGLSDYVEGLSQAKTIQVLPNGEKVEQSSVPTFETFLGAAAARTFRMPATTSSFVRVAQLPAGTPLKVLAGVSF
jgi:hypothetical protein